MRKDYKQFPDGDLDFLAGDLIIGESTQQHQRDLILADKGHVRRSPGMGVGAVNFLQENDGSNYLRAVRMNFTADGMKVKKVGLDNLGNTVIDAEYEDN